MKSSVEARLLVTFLALNVFSSYWQQLNVPVPLDRVIFAALLLYLLMIRRELDQVSAGSGWTLTRSTGIAQAVLALISGLIGSGIFSKYGFVGFVDRVFTPLVCLLVAPYCLRRTEDRALLLRFLIIFGIYLSLTSIFQVAGLHQLVFPKYILDANVGILPDRARGPFAEAVANGLAITMSAIVAYSLLRGGGSKVWYGLSLALVLLAPVGVLLTFTRSVWVCFLAATLVFVLVARKLRVFVVAISVALLPALIALQIIPGLMANLVDRASETRSIDDRINTNETALHLFLNYPLSGIGWARFLPTVLDNVRQLDTVPFTNVNIEVHNVLLARLAELGIAGGSFWALMTVVGPLVICWQHRRRNVAITFCWIVLACDVAYLYVAMLTPLPYPFPTNLLFVLVGGLVAAGRDSSRVTTAPSFGSEAKAF